MVYKDNKAKRGKRKNCEKKERFKEEQSRRNYIVKD